MGKQDKKDKKIKKAAEQAEQIIEAAVGRVGQAIAAVNADEAIKEKRKRGEASPEEVTLGQEVKRLRDGGMAWWLIGHTLGLPGSADNVKQGKGGASRARRLYVLGTGGPLPATPRSLAKHRPDPFGKGAKPQGVQTRRGGAIRKDPGMETMFDEPLTGQEIGDMLRGKRITYINSVGGHEETHRVHRSYGIQITQVGINSWHPPMKVEYAITFRDADAEDDRGLENKFKGMPGGTRTVRLNGIMKVQS